MELHSIRKGDWVSATTSIHDDELQGGPAKGTLDACIPLASWWIAQKTWRLE